MKPRKRNIPNSGNHPKSASSRHQPTNFAVVTSFNRKNHPTNSNHSELFPDKVSLEQLSSIWNEDKSDSRQYSNEDLFRIREWLYTIAEAVLGLADKAAFMARSRSLISTLP